MARRTRRLAPMRDTTARRTHSSGSASAAMMMNSAMPRFSVLVACGWGKTKACRCARNAEIDMSRTRNRSRPAHLVGALAQLLVVGGLRDQVQDGNGQRRVGQRVRLGVRLRGSTARGSRGACGWRRAVGRGATTRCKAGSALRILRQHQTTVISTNHGFSRARPQRLHCTHTYVVAQCFSRSFEFSLLFHLDREILHALLARSVSGIIHSLCSSCPLM